jgi:hypothetical protein
MTHTDPAQDEELTGASNRDEQDAMTGSPEQDRNDMSPTEATLTTAQIARTPEQVPTPQPASTQAVPPVRQHDRTQLLQTDELESIVNRWRDIQAGFVDEPQQAVKDADALVADLMQRLARMFAAEREDLEARWMAGQEVSTEDLRQGLRRYRSFFERLLAA